MARFSVPGKIQAEVEVQVDAYTWEEALQEARELNFTRGDIDVKSLSIDTFCVSEDGVVLKEYTLPGGLVKSGIVKVRAHTLEEAIEKIKAGHFESCKVTGNVIAFEVDQAAVPKVKKVE